jgi:hypothetical protein
MPSNENIAPIQQSGSANVPITESTGGQLQGSQGSDGNAENSSFSGTPGAAANIFSDNVVFSGNITVQNETIIQTGFLSGSWTQGIVIQGAAIGSGSPSLGSMVGLSSGQSPNPTGVVFSGAATNTVQALNSGTFAPLGYFFINVPTSGSPWVKVPFFNS